MWKTAVVEMHLSERIRHVSRTYSYTCGKKIHAVVVVLMLTRNGK